MPLPTDCLPPSLIARSAWVRLACVLVGIVALWAAISWAVSLA